MISATLADMYDPERMDKGFPLVREAQDLPAARVCDLNDEIIERIYLGRRFVQNFLRGDTDHLEKLFELYAKMTSQQTFPKKSGKQKIKGGNNK
ncbi:hypothetical protein [Laspinema olomoucense]|uniref:hypothetical protein n=1 Tax=Laspinema olomoucense TaxID=3231600 RepID=UPI0021BB1AE9|nr:MULTISPECIES: hypothetical protein [unclassified Laspinema]MCT7973666.1 hypothetical protein [Laspinema sp. D3d]MCT7996260.1 hypothetical protein [Laspinema sp. D3c]